MNLNKCPFKTQYFTLRNCFFISSFLFLSSPFLFIRNQLMVLMNDSLLAVSPPKIMGKKFINDFALFSSLLEHLELILKYMGERNLNPCNRKGCRGWVGLKFFNPTWIEWIRNGQAPVVRFCRVLSRQSKKVVFTMVANFAEFKTLLPSKL